MFRTLIRTVSVISVILILMLLAWQCVDIYREGTAPDNLEDSGVYIQQIYRQEDVISRFRAISLPVLACSLSIGLAGLLQQPIPDRRSRDIQRGITPENRLRLIKARTAELTASAQAEERFRKLLHMGCGTVVVLCTIPCLRYLLNRAHFTSWDLETVMADMLICLLPWTAVAFLAACMTSVLHGRSCRREVAALKGQARGKTGDSLTRREYPVTMIRTALYVLAAVLIMLGVLNGGLRDVLIKAINICTECIGLG